MEKKMENQMETGVVSLCFYSLPKPILNSYMVIADSGFASRDFKVNLVCLKSRLYVPD